MRLCESCSKDMSKLKSRHKKCWHCRTGNEPKRQGNVKYSKEILQEAVSKSYSVAEVLRYVGCSGTGGNHSHMTRRIKSYGLDTSHFTGRSHNKGIVARNRKSSDDFLVLGSPRDPRQKRDKLLRSMLECGFEYKCSGCLLDPVWNGKMLVLEVGHINGHFWDNRKENLRFLCPNCHSQQVETNRPLKYRRVNEANVQN